VADGSEPISQLRKVFGALAKRAYEVLDVALCTSTAPLEEPYLTPTFHWFAEIMAQSFADPSLLTRREIPKRWTALSGAARLEDAGNYRQLWHELLPYLMTHEDDPALQLYAASALAVMDRTEEALRRAEIACQLDAGYCSGLPWIGLQRFGAGDFAGGERFFAAAARLRPRLRFGQLARGLWLQSAGKNAEALAVFQGLSDAGDTFPAAFLAGALQLRANDRPAARRKFDLGLKALSDDPAAEITDSDIAQAIGTAAQFYREEGLTRESQLLEDSLRLRFHPAELPPGSP
jgi:tetratricopeptide (TPR) repeat protein